MKLIEAFVQNCNQFALSLNSANQRFSELEEELHVVPVENSALVANIHLQAADTKKLKPEKESVVNLFSEKNRADDPGRKRSQKANICKESQTAIR